MLIRGAPRILGHSVCNKRKLKKDRRTGPIVFLSKMLIRGSLSILGQSVCNKRKLKKDQRDKSPSLSLQDADKRLSQDSWTECVQQKKAQERSPAQLFKHAFHVPV